MCAAVYGWRYLVKATEVTTSLVESNGSLPPGEWKVTCMLTPCTSGSVPGPTLGKDYGKALPLPLQCTSADGEAQTSLV